MLGITLGFRSIRSKVLAAYNTMLILHSTTDVVTAFMWRRLPYVAPTVSKGEPFSFVALKDRKFERAGFYVAIACILYALSAGVPSWAACALLVVAMGVHTAEQRS